MKQIIYQIHATPRGVYHLEYDPPPIPVRDHDWSWWHDDYDGAPHETGGPCLDRRCGTAASPMACIAQIEELEAEN